MVNKGTPTRATSKMARTDHLLYLRRMYKSFCLASATKIGPFKTHEKQSERSALCLVELCTYLFPANLVKYHYSLAV